MKLDDANVGATKGVDRYRGMGYLNLDDTSQPGHQTDSPHVTAAAGDELWSSEDRIRLMVEAVRDYAIYMLDAQGFVVSWNAGAERLKGYRSDEAIGKHFSLFFTPEDVQRGHPQEELRIAKAAGRYEEQGWRVRKDGSRFWANVTITALFDRRGEHFGFGKVTRDLTTVRAAEEDARRLAEAEAARQTAEKLQRMTTALASAVSTDQVARVVLETVLPALGADGGSLAVQMPGTERLRLAWAHGYSQELLRPYREFSIQDRLPHAQAVRERRPIVFTSKEEMNQAYPSTERTNGLHGLMSLPLMVGGGCVGALGVTYRTPRAISAVDRMLALAFADQCALALDRALLFERELEANARAKFLAEASAVLSRTLTPDTILKDLAALAVPRLGDWCAIELVEGDTTRPVAVAHSDPAKVQLAWELREKYPPNRDQRTGVFEVIRTGKAELYPSITDEMVHVAARSPEQLRTLREVGLRSAIVVPLLARDRPLGAMTLVWSETDRTYSRTDLEFVTDLCGRAAFAVENGRLYQELEKAVRIRDDFMSIAGHEIRTPLAALRLHLETIARAAAKNAASIGPRAPDRLTRSLESCDRLDRLVAELLDVSRITANRLQLEPERMDLAALIETVVGQFAGQAEKLNSELRLHVRSGLHGDWDRLRLEQVVSNLLSNALKYGRGKPIDIEAGAEEGFAVLRVRDTGIGIEPEDQQRIFERFERAVSGRHYGGLGLGLWIARQIVQASGGSISVESSPGQGSTFTVRLPLPPAGANRVFD